MRNVLFIMFVLLGCKSNEPNVLPFEKMEVVLWDIIEINSYGTFVLSKDSSVVLREKMAELEKAVFDKHEISSKTFFESYDYYTSDPKLYVRLIDSIMVHNRVKPEDYLPPVKERKNDLKIELNE